MGFNKIENGWEFSKFQPRIERLGSFRVSYGSRSRRLKIRHYICDADLRTRLPETFCLSEGRSFGLTTRDANSRYLKGGMGRLEIQNDRFPFRSWIEFLPGNSATKLSSRDR